MVLYASSQVDKRKVGRLAMAIQVAFQELGVFDTSNTHIPLSDMEAIPFANVQAVQNVERIAEETSERLPALSSTADRLYARWVTNLKG